MNLEIILKMVKPYVKNNAITYDEFEKIFAILSRKEQYAVSEILINNGIELVDEHIDEQVVLHEAELDEQTIADFEDEEFEISYDEALFQDKGNATGCYDSCVINKDIRQSNEILCKLIQQGNQQAAQDLCVKNKKLVKKYVAAYEKRYGNRLDFEDLEQAGFIGLIRAAQKFRMEHGALFSTYAVFWIKQSILREIMDNGYAIRIPVHMMERINRVSTLWNHMSDAGILSKDRISAIANELNISEEDVKEALVLKHNYLTYSSLDVPLGEDQESTLVEFVPDEDENGVEEIVFQKALHQELESAMATLKPREQQILKLRFGWNDEHAKTLEEIGEMHGVTRERIRQVENKAIRKMRHPTRARKFRNFWEE